MLIKKKKGESKVMSRGFRLDSEAKEKALLFSSI